MLPVDAVDEPVIVGAGVAGLSVALGLGSAIVVHAPEQGSTWWAQGGIAAAISSEDSPAEHALDTLEVGGGISVTDAVRVLTEGGPRAIEHLQELGATFDEDAHGDLVLGREGGHHRRRVVHADGDATGAEVMRALTHAVSTAPSIQMRQGQVVDLVRSDDRITGVVLERDGERSILTGTAVILATGGAGRMFARTTNPAGVRGDGIAMAARHGVRLADLEFTQFHPTALLCGADPLPLLTEALRGEGATLLTETGDRLMKDHAMGDLEPRDVVAREIARHMGRGGSVYLDATMIPEVAERFPTVSGLSHAHGFDVSSQALPVTPAAHYTMGGIDADDRGRTSASGLWAVGECSSTGVHGANRLASNSLLEGLVFGARVAVDVGENAETARGSLEGPKETMHLAVDSSPEVGYVREIMWREAGVTRTGAGLWAARTEILGMRRALSSTYHGRVAFDVGLLMVMAALRRSESRGSHFRSDYPDADPLQAHRALIDPPPLDMVPIA